MKRVDRFTLLAVILVGLSAGCGSHETAPPSPTPVTVRAVEAYAGSPGLRYSANIQPHTQVELAFKSGGYIRAILQVRGVDGRMRDVQERRAGASP
jgi:multidrug efflux pump subunit AcrA (membrane-fusion protein)